MALGTDSRVLVFSTAGLGDALLDSAGIRSLAEMFPGIWIEAVVHHRRTDIARHNPFLKKLHFLRKGPHAFLALWWKLRRSGPWSAVLYMSCHDPEARCLGYLLARDATIGLAWRTKMPWLCARNIDEPALRKAHLAAQAVRVAREAGAAGDAVRMVYEVSAGDSGALDARLTEMGFPHGPGVVFQLGGGGGAYRDWPVGHFVALARMAHSAGIGPLFILGGPDHRSRAGEFSEAAGSLPFFDVVGKLSLPLSAALIKRARCLVSTDTGIMHLAFAVGTPTVALLHCSPGANRVGPAADREKHVVIALPRPEGYRSPRDASMSAIAPEEAFEGLKELFFRSA
jgi:ADP-heptose:LPS heptosyltransferase